MVGLFVLLFFSGKHIMALSVFIVAGLTDVLDGMLARRFKWVTNLGKFLDPFADKLMQCVVLVCLYIAKLIPWWLVAFCVLKEFLMIFGAMFLFRRKNIVVVSGWCGKLAVCVFYVAIFSIIIYPDMPRMLLIMICTVTALTALFAICKYYSDYIRHKSIRTSVNLADVGETIK